MNPQMCAGRAGWQTAYDIRMIPVGPGWGNSTASRSNMTEPRIIVNPR
jgi:hypothetical protein